MAKSKSGKLVRGTELFVRKLAAGTSILVLLVVLVVGIRAEVPLDTTIFRACGSILVIGLICRILLKVLSSYEEINRGQV